ncbi:MAG: hypothetical protein RJA22_2231 [Verrucomicrobiota bacterium]
MTSLACRLLLVTLLVGLAGLAAGAPAPNIIFILADDLGYGDLGSFGQAKIRTPHLDRLAAGGMRFTRHYSGSPVCAPSRCVLMTGRHPGHAFIRDNRDARQINPGAASEGQAPLPAGTVTLPGLLRERGYVTGAFGKWGLGPPGSEGDPLRQGFDRFYGYNCQRAAHNFYPTSLWDNTTSVPLRNPAFSAHQKLKPGADTNDAAAYQAFSGRDYAPDLIHEQALRFVREHRARPFFLYLPTTVPHLALQVPEDSLAEYAGRFPETPYPGGRAYLPHRTPRAAYAAMITRLDREVGRLLDLLRELGLEERTLVVFTSDNGPLYDQLGGTDTEFFNSASGLRGRKGSLYEGGIRVPLIVRWPGQIPAGQTSDRVTGFEDWVPTLLELTGKAGPPPRQVDGISFAPTLMGQKQEARPFLYREFPAYGGQQSLVLGDWKGIRQQLLAKAAQNNPGRGKLQLYHLAKDPNETTDVAAQHPEVVARIERLLREQHTPSALFPFPALDRASP